MKAENELTRALVPYIKSLGKSILTEKDPDEETRKAMDKALSDATFAVTTGVLREVFEGLPTFLHEATLIAYSKVMEDLGAHITQAGLLAKGSAQILREKAMETLNGCDTTITH